MIYLTTPGFSERKESALTTLGKQQAERLGHHLGKTIESPLIFPSPHFPCIQTARIVKNHTGGRTHIGYNLHEREIRATRTEGETLHIGRVTHRRPVTRDELGEAVDTALQDQTIMIASPDYVTALLQRTGNAPLQPTDFGSLWECERTDNGLSLVRYTPNTQMGPPSLTQSEEVPPEEQPTRPLLG